jgi:C4-dicarboxylate-specific signal transduction histidine kinase
MSDVAGIHNNGEEPGKGRTMEAKAERKGEVICTAMTSTTEGRGPRLGANNGSRNGGRHGRLRVMSDQRVLEGRAQLHPLGWSESDQRHREMQMEFSHANRLATMGRLTTSIAHEVNQPIAATATNAHAALRWLKGQMPGLGGSATGHAKC